MTLRTVALVLGLTPLALIVPAPAAVAQSVPKFTIAHSPIQLEGPARPGIYLGGVGRRAAHFGTETGGFEAWAWPIKLFHDFQLGFKIPDYTEPIPGASIARHVIARPEAMTVVYSHATFTVRQHFIVPLNEPGVIVLLDVQSVTPLEIVASFQADLDLMWPAGIGGQYAIYLSDRRRFLLSESRREYNAYIGSPFATEGSTHPAHATPDAPSAFRITVDPARTEAEFIPIVIAGGILPRDSLNAIYDRLLANTESVYKERVEHARVIREGLAAVQTPDSTIDLALEWAKVNLDESYACNPDLGCGLVAGYGPSGRGRRPGFGWFFGGDASINILGILPYGGFELARAGLDFQRRHRRADGKMPHEVTQSALRTRTDWFKDFPYAYYHADTTPYWVVALYQYWLQSGDTAFVRASWNAVVDAYRWGLANDSDGDGIVDNTAAGLGAVEVGALGEGLHQDIYLAAIWVESLRATSELGAAMGDVSLAQEAAQNFERAWAALEREYYIRDEGIYAFGVLEGGKTNPAVTVWPAVALSFNLLEVERAQKHLDALASHRLLSDWGARMLDSEHALYDPLQYNMGTVWPFVTGFAGWALYNYGRPHAGFASLWANARNTFHDALGRNPELMSGAFFRTLDTTVPHQFFATSMIPTPLFRGLFGLEANAPRNALRFAPSLPADWDSAAVLRYPVGASRLDIELRRGEETYGRGCDLMSAAVLRAHFRRSGDGAPVRVRYVPSLAPGSRVLEVRVDSESAPYERIEGLDQVRVALTVTVLDEADVAVLYEPGIDVAPRRLHPPDGYHAAGLAITRYRHDRASGDYVLQVEGLGGRGYGLQLIGTPVSEDVRGAALRGAAPGRTTLRVPFDAPPGRFQTKTVRFRGR